MNRPLEDRFWEKVNLLSDDECWEWKATRSHKGYGEFYSKLRGGRKTRAHQVAWILSHGEIPDGMCVCHKCDNPACVNPRHLFVGTALDNNKDKMEKGRWKSRFLYGIDHPQHGTKSKFNKLTEDNVKEIRILKNSGYTLRSIAERFGVSHGVVNNIIQGRKWSWLK